MIKHIQRDGVYVNLADSLKAAWSSDSPNTNQSFIINGPAGVEDKQNSVQSEDNVVKAVAASNKSGIGLYMTQPVNDRYPYRVKAYAAAASGHEEFMLGVGYAPASPTGSTRTPWHRFW